MTRWRRFGSCTRATKLLVGIGVWGIGVSAWAQAPACTSDRDCPTTAPHCAATTVARLPPKLCFPISGASLSTGADGNERFQEASISGMVNALRPLAGELRPATVKELQAAVDREDADQVRDDAAIAKGMRAAYAAVARLDAYERMLLLRYLKRQLATALEKRLFILLDIVRHPPVDDSTDLASLDQRIEAEQLRLRGLSNDRPALCAELAVLERLRLERADIVLARSLRSLQTSNLTTEARARQTADAERQRDSSRQAVRAGYGAACSGAGATFPAPPALPPPAPRPPREPYRFTLFSSDPVEVPRLAAGAGLPPVTTAAWDRVNAGKAAVQRQDAAEQRQQSSESARQRNAQANARINSASADYSAELQAAQQACAARNRALDPDRGRRGNERDLLNQQIDAIVRAVQQTPCPGSLNVAGCMTERSRLMHERTSAQSQRLKELDREDRAADLRARAQVKAVEAQCQADVDAATSRLEKRTGATADAYAAAPVKKATASAVSPSYSGLTEYDPAGVLLQGKVDEEGAVFLKWVFRMIGDSWAESGLDEAHIKVSPAPYIVSPVEIAQHLANYAHVEPGRDTACWGVLSLKIALGPLGDVPRLNGAMELFMSFPSPGEVEPKPCPEH